MKIKINLKKLLLAVLLFLLLDLIMVMLLSAEPSSGSGESHHVSDFKANMLAMQENNVRSEKSVAVTQLKKDTEVGSHGWRATGHQLNLNNASTILNFSYLIKSDTTKLISWRLQALKERCSRAFPESSPRKTFKKFVLPGKTLVSQRFKIVIYTVYKGGCSSWFYTLANNSKTAESPNLNEPQIVSSLWKKNVLNKFHVQFLEQLPSGATQTYYHVLSIRHPLSRIESAYSEKMKPLVFCKKYGKEIAAKYRQICQTTDEELNSIEQCVTFCEFLEFLLDGKNFQKDMHWWPYIRDPSDSRICSLKFDYLARTETQDFDINYIIHTQLAGIGGSVHSNTAVERLNSHTLPVFSTLHDPETYIKRLLQRYQTDMLVFGYTYRVQNGTVYALCETYYGQMCV